MAGVGYTLSIAAAAGGFWIWNNLKTGCEQRVDAISQMKPKWLGVIIANFLTLLLLSLPVLLALGVGSLFGLSFRDLFGESEP